MNLPFNLLFNLPNIPGLTNSLDVFKKYQREIETFFRHVKWIDMRTGVIVLTEKLINQEWKPIILDQLPEVIKDLEITLVDDLIRINIIVKMKGLAFKVCYDIALESFEFKANSHKLVLAICNESVKAEKGLLNKLLMSIINALFMGLIGKTILNKLIEKQPGVTFNNDSKKIVVDLERLPQFQKYLEIAILEKPIITLVEMAFMGINEKGIRFNISIQPPILSMKDVRGVLGF